MSGAPTSLAEEALFLDAREARLAERETALALNEAELRGRERAQRPETPHERLALTLQERAALLSAREQLLARRRAHVARRDAELAELEEAQSPRRAPKNPRHNETISMPVSESDRMDADALVPRELQRANSRTTPAPTLVEPPPRQKDPTQCMPLPDRAPQGPRARPSRPTTTPFMAALTFGGLSLERSQLEIDRESASVRLLLSGPLPAVEGAKTLRYRSRDGMEASYDVALRHIVSRPPSGTVIVLDASGWSEEAFASFARAVELLP